VIVVFVTGIGSALQETISLKASSAVCISLFLASIALSVWQIVGTWRSAANHVQRGGLKAWAVLAQISLVFCTLRLVGTVADNVIPQSLEYWRILCGDTRIPRFELRLLQGGKEIDFRGGIRAGAAHCLDLALKRAPQATVLRVNSLGGRIQEATRMARLVREHSLDTYTSEYCMSAATLVFIAGKQRVISEGAKVGFHMGTFPGLTPEQLRAGNELVRRAMAAAGISEDFIARAVATPNTEIWYPTIAEMRSAGVITGEDAPLKAFASNVLALIEGGTNAAALAPQRTGHEDMDRLTGLTTTLFARWGQLFDEMNSKLDAAGEPSVHADATLGSEERLRESIEAEERRRKVIEEYRLRIREAVFDAKTELGAIKLADPEAQGMLKGITNSLQEWPTQAEQLLNLRIQVEADKMTFLEFMLRHFADYTLAGDQITFKEAYESSRYGYLTKAVSLSTSALDDFQAEMLKSVEAGKQKLKTFSQ
jgi:hypothetical protein